MPKVFKRSQISVGIRAKNRSYCREEEYREVLAIRGYRDGKGWTYDASDAYTRRPFHGQARDGNTCSLAESQAARSCFVRARAAAPTKSGIFPISKWLMRLDARMSNLFYWMYTLAPPVPRYRIIRSALFRQGNWLAREPSLPLSLCVFHWFFHRCSIFPIIFKISCLFLDGFTVCMYVIFI